MVRLNMKQNQKKLLSKKGYIAFSVIIITMISTMFLVFFIGKINGNVGGWSNRIQDNVLAVEKKNGQQIAIHPGNSKPIKPDVWIPGDPSTDIDKVIITRELYFDDPYPSMKTEEVLNLTVKSTPDGVTERGITWQVMKGKDLAHIIRNIDSRNIEITGVEPGRLVLQAKAKDTSNKVAYAFIDIIQDPKDITLSQEKINLSIGQTVKIKATVLPEDTTDKQILWSYANPNNSECISFKVNKDELTITAKNPAGLSCDKGKIVKIKAETADPNIYKILEITTTR